MADKKQSIVVSVATISTAPTAATESHPTASSPHLYFEKTPPDLPGPPQRPMSLAMARALASGPSRPLNRVYTGELGRSVPSPVVETSLSNASVRELSLSEEPWPRMAH